MCNILKTFESYSFRGVALCLLLTLLTVNIAAQESTLLPPSKVCLNAGVMMGGGGLFGADIQALVLPNISCQMGVGLSSFGGGLNYHFKPGIKSPFLSLQYWQIGRAANHDATYIGPMFIYRNKSVFQAGVGYAYVVDKGAAITKPNQNFALMLQFGLCFPL